MALAPANATNPGVMTFSAQEIGGLKNFALEPKTDPYDVRKYGAVANDTTSDFGQAFYNTLANVSINPAAAYPLTQSALAYGVSMPQGNFYTSMPLCLPGACDIHGLSRERTFVRPGVDRVGTANVPTFSGPVLYAAGLYDASSLAALTDTNVPAFGAPLVGAIGQSMKLYDGRTGTVTGGLIGLPLHDSWAWGGWIGNDHLLTNWSLELWVQVDTPASLPALNAWIGGVIGSRGSELWTERGSDAFYWADMAFGIYAVSDNVNIKLRAVLTTSTDYIGEFSYARPGTEVVTTIDSSNITNGVPIHVEFDYDGSHVDFYVNGVNQGHIAVTGPIIKAGNEGVFIGRQGSEGLDGPVSSYNGITGYIDSIRMSNVARHTGTGSFTPPTSKYTWDTNTMALYNWDAPFKTIQAYDPLGAPVGSPKILPFVVGEANGSVGIGPTLTNSSCPHYIRLYGATISPDNEIHDFTVNGNISCSGLITSNAPRNYIYNFWVTQTSQYGIRIGTGVSFYTFLDDIATFWNYNVGLQMFGVAKNVQNQGGRIGLWTLGSVEIQDCASQTTFAAWAPLYIEPGPGGAFTNVHIIGFGNDAEVWWYRCERAVVLINGQSLGGVTFQNNGLDANGSDAPVIQFVRGLPRYFVATGDVWAASAPQINRNNGSPCFIGANFEPLGSITVANCSLFDPNTVPIPISNYSDFVTRYDADGMASIKSLSTSDKKAKNLAGSFSVVAGTQSGGPIFVNSEPDTDYIVNVTPQGYLGSPPAAGSTNVLNITNNTDGFIVEIGADPGGTCLLNFGYTLVRTDPSASTFIYLPSVPSTTPNPFAGEVNLPFYCGVTVVPASNHTIHTNLTRSAEVVISAGTYPDYWLYEYYNGLYDLAAGWGSLYPGEFGARVWSGKLRSQASPGAHNHVIGYDGRQGWLALDGTFFGSGIATALGTQAANVYIGQDPSSSGTLTQATLRNFKMDRSRQRVVSSDSDIGPGLQAQAAIYGDRFAIGYYCTTDAGSWAQRLCDVRYGDTFYHMAVRWDGKLTDSGAGLVQELWAQWQGQAHAPQLHSVCLQAGLLDIIQGATSSDMMDNVVALVEGQSASVDWYPPTTNAGQFAWFLSAIPTSGTSTLTIDGTTVNIPSIGSNNATRANALSVINANVTIAANFNAQEMSPVQPVVIQIWCNTAGTIGNAYVASTNGVGGSILYGDVGGNIPGNALSLHFNRRSGRIRKN